MTLTSKEKIIKAAIKVFAAKGYDGTSMDGIAQAARLTKPMIYYHFKNKESLYESVLAGIYKTARHKVQGTRRESNFFALAPSRLADFIRAISRAPRFRP